MNFNLTMVGFGVIGVETLYNLSKKIRSNKQKNYIIAIIEKDLKNIPGGVAYSLEKSKFGFFNNPLRLAHPDFIRWINKNNNKKRIKSFIYKNPKYQLKKWYFDNRVKFEKKIIDQEIYLPRIVYSFYLKDKIFKIIKNFKISNIRLFFLKGELNNINLKNNYILESSNIYSFYRMVKRKNDIIFLNIKKKIKIIKSNKVVIGNGILPPKIISSKQNSFPKNYMWNFYSEGGTSQLINRLKTELKRKKKIVITFIGNKAGLLETTLKLREIISKTKKKIMIYVISNSLLTLNKARFSENQKYFRFRFFKKSEIKKIKSSAKILLTLKKEFKFAIKNGFNTYDVWTNILKSKILLKIYNGLSSNEKKKYNLKVFSKIRNLTRFTFPKTVEAKEDLENKGNLKFIKGKGKLIKFSNKKIYVLTDNKKKVESDIVINVSGPVSIDKINNEVSFIKSIKFFSKKFDKTGFITDKDFMLEEGLFLPGVLSTNFNPTRETIIKAISNNSKKVAKALLSKGL